MNFGIEGGAATGSEPGRSNPPVGGYAMAIPILPTL